MNQSHKQDRKPLSEIARPRDFDQLIGQNKILGKGSIIKTLISSNKTPSMILYGPPGCGKTSFARLLSDKKHHYYIELSAVTVGVQEVKKAIETAKQIKKNLNKVTILFLDEVHRFNKAQQDILLPYIENGTIIFIGATTENPSFSLNNALLSRTQVLLFEKLTDSDLENILARALDQYYSSITEPLADNLKDAIMIISKNSDGDSRRALDTFQNLIEYALSENLSSISEKTIIESLNNRTHTYDKNGQYHYDLISAFIKSMRASRVDAALYWMTRMLDAGEDPLFITRRMIIFASEDIGLADSNALQVAISADQAYRRLGMPEGYYPLTHACAYLSLAPKSRKCDDAIRALQKYFKKNSNSLEVPLHLRNAVTPLMKEWGYGKTPKYEEKHYLPIEIKDEIFWPK